VDRGLDKVGFQEVTVEEVSFTLLMNDEDRALMRETRARSKLRESG
jgi:hypothetical protein